MRVLTLRLVSLATLAAVNGRDGLGDDLVPDSPTHGTIYRVAPMADHAAR